MMGLNTVVSFPRTVKVVKQASGNKAVGKLNEKQLEGYEWVKTKGGVVAIQELTY